MYPLNALSYLTRLSIFFGVEDLVWTGASPSPRLSWFAYPSGHPPISKYSGASCSGLPPLPRGRPPQRYSRAHFLAGLLLAGSTGCGRTDGVVGLLRRGAPRKCPKIAHQWLQPPGSWPVRISVSSSNADGISPGGQNARARSFRARRAPFASC